MVANEPREAISLNARWVAAWTERMAQKYGGIVRGKDGTSYDWGQALARTQYGEDWNDVVPEGPSDADVQRARWWERGNWPGWVQREDSPDLDKEQQMCCEHEWGIVSDWKLGCVKCGAIMPDKGTVGAVPQAQAQAQRERDVSLGYRLAHLLMEKEWIDHGPRSMRSDEGKEAARNTLASDLAEAIEDWRLTDANGEDRKHKLEIAEARCDHG